MKRPIVTLGLVGLLVFPMTPGCNQAVTPEEDDDNNGSSGSGNSSAGSGGLVIPTAGTGNTAAGTGNVAPTAGTGTGGSAPAATGGMSGGGTAGASGGAAAGGGATGGTGGAANPAGCPVKIDSKVACTQVITCPDAYCGVHQLGSKNCECVAPSGMFTCTSCTYAGKTEEILVKPEAALPACASDDATLEDTPGCTKGMRCHSLTADKNRFCACWESPTDGVLAWDCDTQPSDWPL